ncbi:MAG TPA: protease inhibitor I9 family protein, partial [Micromonosporaceae bacterium]|nr:protease inhibitor I9 family protein [Micromonosporaceae bacterium]
MSLSATAGRRRPVTIALTTAAITALALVGTGSVQARPGAAVAGTATYIVQVAGAPIASYAGGVAGIAATQPAEGDRVDTRSAAARALHTRLQAQHGDVLRRAGVATSQKVYDYSVAFNGFAARLTAGQAARLKSAPGVLRVWQSEVLKADTISTPRFLGLEGSGGVWDAKFGSPAKAGLGVIV